MFYWTLYRKSSLALGQCLYYFSKPVLKMIKEPYMETVWVGWALSNVLGCASFFDLQDSSMSERMQGKGSFNTSQSVPCGALLVCRCHSRCLGGHEGHGDPGGKRDWPSLAHIIKSISWQLAGERLPSVTTRSLTTSLTFSTTFSQSTACFLSLVRLDSTFHSTGQSPLWSMAPLFWEGRKKSNLTWVFLTFALSSTPPGSPSRLWVIIFNETSYSDINTSLQATQST